MQNMNWGAGDTDPPSAPAGRVLSCEYGLYHRPCGLGGYTDPEHAPDMEYRTEEAASAKEQQKINALRCEFLKAFVFLSD